MISGLTYNIYLGRNLPAIRNWLQTHQPYDIICLQEFPQSKIQYFLRPPYFSRYEYQYAPSFKMQTEVFGELTLVRRDKLKIKKHTIIELGTNMFEEFVLKLLWNRTSLVTKLRYKKTDIILANTHLIAYASNRQRREQLESLFRSVNHLQKKQAVPTIVVGDMNYTSLLSRSKLFELLTQQGYVNAYSYHTHKLLAVKDHQLDYIFYKGCDISNVKVIQQPFSDHLPIQFSIELPMVDD